MKKIIAIMLTLLMVFGLVACGGEKETGATTEPEFTVGFIFIGAINDNGYTQAHYEGMKAMEAHFGGKVKTLYMENVSDGDKQASMSAATTLLGEGCNVIVGCSFGFMDSIKELANDPANADKYFLHFSGYEKNDTNFDNFFGAMEEPRYLTGIIAGSMTKTNKVGFVAAHPFTEVQIGINAFALGAQSVNPDVEVKVVYINSWYDPEKEKSAAEQLFAEGCDVITQHSDTTGPQIAAKEAKGYSIGYNYNHPAAPEAYLTAPVWNHGAYYINTMESIFDGSFKPMSYYGTMKDGYIDLAPMTDLVPADVQEKVEAVKAKMVAGEFAPFSGKIEYANGKVLCNEGQTLTRDEIWAIKDVIKGVTAF